MRSRIAFLFLGSAGSVALAALMGCGPKPNAQGPPTKAEARTGLIYEANLHEGPETLRAFLADFPKGADLHVHLSGRKCGDIYPRGRCGRVVRGQDYSEFFKAALQGKSDPGERVRGRPQPGRPGLPYYKLIDAFSLRSFVAMPSWSGHDQFFATFARFGGLSETHHAEWVAEVASRSAAENNQYVELMHTPTFGHAAQIAHTIGWNAKLAAADPQVSRAVSASVAGSLTSYLRLPRTVRRRRRCGRRGRRVLEHW